MSIVKKKLKKRKIKIITPLKESDLKFEKFGLKKRLPNKINLVHKIGCENCRRKNIREYVVSIGYQNS